MARRLKDVIIHLDYKDEYKDGKVEVNIIASEPEELVRCKDCKYGDVFLDKEDRLCLLTGTWKEPCHFCSDGERKEG